MKKTIFSVLCLVFLLSAACFVSCGGQENLRVQALELQSSEFSINLVERTACLKVANAVTDYDFSDKFTVADGARFDVCTDKQCNDKIASKKTDIAIGNNVFYILVTNGNDVASYTVVLRRRPIYTVTFNADDGNEIETQQVEEDGYVRKPTFLRRGYDFIECDYDFSLPVLKDETITAKFSVKEEMKNYKFTSTPYNCTITGIINKSVTNVVIPDYVTSIDKGAFRGCSNLKSVTIGDGVISIDEQAFSGCVNLVSITFGNHVTFIGDGAFYSCKGLEKIIIPESVTSVSFYAFLGCGNIKYNEYENALYLGSENNPYHALIKAKSTSIARCIINKDCRVIARSAFDCCNDLTSITIPDGVTSIGDLAFVGCVGLASITIPDSVTSIGFLAFCNCSNLTEIHFKGTIAEWESIEKTSGWDMSTGDYAVYCTDGNVKK